MTGTVDYFYRNCLVVRAKSHRAEWNEKIIRGSGANEKFTYLLILFTTTEILTAATVNAASSKILSNISNVNVYAYVRINTGCRQILNFIS